tara:strand:- start:7720 stop:8637 length:918 start_codon:yes stop_codon:yes gene_type:complete
MNAEILLDVGGSLVFDPPQPGRPSSATVEIFAPSGASLVSSGPVDTIDPVNTSIGSSASAGSTSLTLASSANVATGRRYVLKGADGFHEWVRVKAVNTTTHVVTLSHEIGHTYASAGSSFVGNRLTEAVSAATASILDAGYSAVWKYTIAGTDHRVVQYFDVVRAAWTQIVIAPWQFALVAGDLASSDLESLSQEGLDFADEIAEATRRVREDVFARGYRPALFRSFDNFVEPICQRVLLTFAERGESVPMVYQDNPIEWLELRREVYQEAITAALNSANYDADESGDITDEERASRLGSVRITL